ncbi:MAG TPA: glycosyl hydrolase, partial [Turneriella sp.]|nr:glycosyl hydrolase [Turneriella sp.]
MKKKKVLQEEQVNPPAEPEPAPEESQEGQPSGRKKLLVAAAIGGIALLVATPFVLRLFKQSPQVHIDKAAVSSPRPQSTPSFKASTWSSDFKVMLQY